MRTSIPDLLSLSNAALGFGAIVSFSSGNFETGARLILLAGVIDGLDGFTARRTGGSDLGKQLDSLADAVSFGVAPTFFVYYISKGMGIISVLSAFFLLSALVRLAAYNLEATDKREKDMSGIKLPIFPLGSKSNSGFTGVPSTLAAGVLCAVYLANITSPQIILVLAVGFSYLMLAQIYYPKLKERDALIGGALITIAAIIPDFFHSLFPILLLFCFIAFLLLSPKFYWKIVSNPG